MVWYSCCKHHWSQFFWLASQISGFSSTRRLFLWGFLKSKAYVNKPQTLQQLKDNIQEEIDRIPQEILNKVMENAIKRAHFCVRENGSHLTDIIFHN